MAEILYNTRLPILVNLRNKMSKNITITLSDVQVKALELEMVDIYVWAENFVTERARLIIERIAASEINRKMEAGEPIVGTKEDLVLQASLQSLAEKLEELEAQQLANE